MAYVALPPYDVEITKKWCKKEVDYILPAEYISIYVVVLSADHNQRNYIILLV